MPFAKDIMGAGLSAGTAQALNGSVNTALASAGTVQGDAATIVASYTIVTGADGTKGVILPACQPGDSCQIVNNSGSTLKVYPPTGAAISVPGTGLGSANSSYAHTTYAVCEYFCFSATQFTVQKSA